MQRLQPLLRERGIPVELLPGVEREQELLMMQLSADEGPTIYVLANGDGMAEDTLNDLIQTFSDERSRAHRLLVLEVSADDELSMVDAVVRARNSMLKHRSSRDVPAARGPIRKTQKGLPIQRDPRRDQVGPIPSSIRAARGSEPERRNTPSKNEDRYAFGMDLPPNERGEPVREVLEVPAAPEPLRARRHVTPLRGMPPIVERRPDFDARTDAEPDKPKKVPDALAGMPVAIEDDATPIPPQLRDVPRRPTPQPGVPFDPARNLADAPTPADGTDSKPVLPMLKPPPTVETPAAEASLPELITVPVEAESPTASGSLSVDPPEAVEEMETTRVKTRPPPRRFPVMLAAVGLVLVAGAAFFAFGPSAADDDASNRVARGAAAQEGDSVDTKDLAAKDPKPTPKADPVPEPDPAPDADPAPKADPAPDADPTPDTKPDPAADPDPDPDPDPDSETKVDPPTAPVTARDQLIEARRINEALDAGKIHALDALLFFTPIPIEPVAWGAANGRCRKATVNRIGVWRLPTLKEAKKLRSARRLRTGTYWTTTKAGEGGNFVVPSRGKASTAEKSEQNLAVCVRKRIEG